MTVAPHILRRYVIERASGQTPRAEWAYYAADIGAWIRADEASARHHEHYRRIRKARLPWCDVLGHQTSVADDVALQIYFMTLDQDDWPRLAAAVRERPGRCLKEWTASGARIIAAVSDLATSDATSAASGNDGPLAGWPPERGMGPRSLLPR